MLLQRTQIAAHESLLQFILKNWNKVRAKYQHKLEE